MSQPLSCCALINRSPVTCGYAGMAACAHTDVSTAAASALPPSVRLAAVKMVFVALVMLNSLMSHGSILEKPKRFRAVAHQHILGLLVMIEHHLVRLPADAGFLITAEGRVRGICVVAIGPYASGLDASSEPICAIQISRPNAGAEPVHGVVGNLERLIRRIKS